MKIETFDLERVQSLWENRVKYNLTESGIHPYTLDELFTHEEIEKLHSVRLGYGQTNGSIALREAVGRLYRGLDLDNVLITTGSAESNFIASWSLLEPGDEMVYMLPNYQQLWGLARSFGSTVKPFHLRQELNWEPDCDELRAAVSGKTKLIAVCNPNNPTGHTLSEESIKTIVKIASDAGVWLYADEIYRGAELEGEETPSFMGTYEKVIVNGGLSKAYALPGLRVGWLAGPKGFIEDAWAYHDYTTISSPILSNEIATLVLQPEMRKKILNRSHKILTDNLVVLTNWVQERKDLFSFIPPKAGGLAFLKYAMDINSTEFVTKLRERKNVLVIAGDNFGMDGYIRIGIGAEQNCFLTGLNLIDELVREL
jgi:aspartate/methionine/tyrosine aminotransferase